MMPGMQENGDAAIHVIGNIRKRRMCRALWKITGLTDRQSSLCTEDLMLAAIEDESMRP